LNQGPRWYDLKPRRWDEKVRGEILLDLKRSGGMPFEDIIPLR